MSNYSTATKATRFGMISIRNPGPKKAPKNLQTLHRRKKDGYTKDAGDVVLQGPALRAFREAEVLATPRRLRRKGKVVPIQLTGVGYRSFDSQAALYYGPDNTNGTRFANPNGSMHVEALAVDIHTGFLAQFAGRKARAALIKVGFIFGVPGESWHASFGFSG